MATRLDQSINQTLVVMPVYNAAQTLKSVAERMPRNLYGVIAVDDSSSDGSADVARRLGFQVIEHSRNAGYGATQKTCYRAALRTKAEFVVMLHPDGQHDPSEIPSLIRTLADGADLVIGSRFCGDRSPVSQGMPWYRYLANRLLTALGNIALRTNLSEMHSGFRAYRAAILREIPLGRLPDGFEFDEQMLIEAAARGKKFAEAPVSTRYGPHCSSISVALGLRYCLWTLWDLARYRIYRRYSPAFFDRT